MPSEYPTQNPSIISTIIPIQNPTIAPSKIPTIKPTQSPTVFPTEIPTTPTYFPTCLPTRVPTNLPTRSPTAIPTQIPTTPTKLPTNIPTRAPTFVPTQIPTTPTNIPTLMPTRNPSIVPTKSPTDIPTQIPTSPTHLPTIIPTRYPTIPPTFKPTCYPTQSPTTPTYIPTNVPTRFPTFVPTFIPTTKPTFSPTQLPSSQPSSHPSNPSSMPSKLPSCQPTNQPTVSPAFPSSQPSKQPSHQPFHHPSQKPICQPSSQPSHEPSLRPTSQPSKIPPCFAGTYYVLLPASYKCTPCPVGTYSTAQSTECTPCPIGTYADSVGTATCIPCAQNFYADNIGTIDCNACPASNVNSGTGSFSSADCVNPTLNFALGLCCLSFAFLVIYIYIIAGRLQRVAFQRRFLVTRKIVTMFGYVNNVLFITWKACQAILSIRAALAKEEEDEILKQPKCSWKFIYLKIARFVKPILFIMAVLVMAIAIIVGTFVFVFMHVLFNALLIWRGYQPFVDITFTYLDRVTVFLRFIDVTLNINFAQQLAYPFVYVLNAISSININFASVNITCLGSQAPIYLFLNCVIVGAVVFIIQSDAHIFWLTLVHKISFKYGALQFNRYYFGENFCSTFSGPLYAIISLIFYVCPTPMKIIQYMLGFLSLGLFFAQNGRSASSTNCDTALSFPIDTMTAVLTTIVVYILLPAIMYMFAQVLVPSFAIPGGHNIPIVKDNNNQSKKTAICFSKRNKYFCGSKYLHTVVVLIWKALSALLAIDWILFKTMFNISIGMYNFLRNFLMKMDEKNKETTSHNHRLRSMLRKELDTAQLTLPTLNWFHALQYFQSDEVSTMELKEEKASWNKMASHFPPYSYMVNSISKSILHDMDQPNRFTRFLIKSLSWIPLFQIFCSPIGFRYWKKIMENYGTFFLMSFGIWTESTGKSYTIMEKFLDYEYLVCHDPRTQDAIPLDDPLALSDEVEDENDVEVKLYEEDDRILSELEQRQMFIQFFSATASSRSVLIQLIYGMTAFAVLSVDLSTCPIFVFSKAIQSSLPPLLLTNCWTLATSHVRRTTRDNEPSIWKIFLLSIYMFISDSRLIQYFIILQINCVALGIVFFPHHLSQLVGSLVIVTFMVAFGRVGNYVLDLHDFFFPTSLAVDEGIYHSLLQTEETHLNT